MRVPVTCPSCGKQGSVREDILGRSIKCKACGKAFFAQALGTTIPRQVAGNQVLLPEQQKKPAKPEMKSGTGANSTIKTNPNTGLETAISSEPLRSSATTQPLTTIRYSCPMCGQRFVSKDCYAGGEEVVCTGCGQPIEIPDPELETAITPAPPLQPYEKQVAHAASLPRIGGWLILPAIGLVFGPFRSVIEIIDTITNLRPAYVFDLVFGVAFLVFRIWVAIAFFSRWRSAPKLVIALILTALGWNTLWLAVDYGMGVSSPDWVAVIWSLVGAAIWIPYFAVSKRVKATFVVGGSGPAIGAGDAFDNTCGQGFAESTPKNYRKALPLSRVLHKTY